MTGGHLNGSGRDHGDDGKVASLADARMRAAARAKQEKRDQRATRLGAMSVRDWVIGSVFVAMTLGMLWHWLSPLVRATGVAR